MSKIRKITSAPVIAWIKTHVTLLSCSYVRCAILPLFDMNQANIHTYFHENIEGPQPGWNIVKSAFVNNWHIFKINAWLLDQVWLAILEPLAAVLVFLKCSSFSGIESSAGFPNITPLTICSGNFSLYKLFELEKH